MQQAAAAHFDGRCMGTPRSANLNKKSLYHSVSDLYQRAQPQAAGLEITITLRI